MVRKEAHDVMIITKYIQRPFSLFLIVYYVKNPVVIIILSHENKYVRAIHNSLKIQLEYCDSVKWYTTNTCINNSNT